MLILNADEVREALPMAACVEAMKYAFSALSSGEAEVPLRTRLAVPSHDGLALFMPAYVSSPQGQALALKTASLFNQNPTKGLPLIHAAVLAIDPGDGRILALLEGSTLTAIRTGAGCAAATDILANPEAKSAAIFGAGAQARTQLEALCAVRPIERAWVYAPRSDQVQAFIEEMAGQGAIPRDLRPAASPEEAVRAADIVSAATTSPTPVFEHQHLKAGAHVNGAGSYSAEMQEIPAETLAAALVSVDSRSAARAESGDISIPIDQGLISETGIAEIGEIIAGKRPGRSSTEQFTVFKSVGVAVQDAVAASLALEKARELDLGTEVDW